MGIDSVQLTKTLCRIHHIGLDAREEMVIRSMMRIAPELGRKFVFGPPTASDPVDIVFVNGDDVKSLRQWELLSRMRPDVVPILLVESDRQVRDLHVIKKPLKFRRFNEVLEAITASGVSHVTGGGDSAPFKVLVVDDSYPARQYMKFKLEELAGPHMNLHMSFAADGEEALQAAQRESFDLAFVDGVMPGMDGYELCARLKKLSATYLVLLTGQDSIFNRVKGETSRCDTFLVKPASDEALQATMLKVLETRQAQRA